jgi:hypothetical protein
MTVAQKDTYFSGLLGAMVLVLVVWLLIRRACYEWCGTSAQDGGISPDAAEEDDPVEEELGLTKEEQTWPVNSKNERGFGLSMTDIENSVQTRDWGLGDVQQQSGYMKLPAGDSK